MPLVVTTRGTRLRTALCRNGDEKPVLASRYRFLYVVAAWAPLAEQALGWPCVEHLSLFFCQLCLKEFMF